MDFSLSSHINFFFIYYLFHVQRSYETDTLVLEATFRSERGVIKRKSYSCNGCYGTRHLGNLLSSPSAVRVLAVRILEYERADTKQHKSSIPNMSHMCYARIHIAYSEERPIAAPSYPPANVLIPSAGRSIWTRSPNTSCDSRKRY